MMQKAAQPVTGETLIHEANGNCLIRLVDEGTGALIVKKCLARVNHGGAARSSLHNERRILERLQGERGCPRLLRFDAERLELVLSDTGGVPLKQSALWANPDLARFLALAETLAVTLAGIHAKGVIHKDLNPSSILIRDKDFDDFDVQIVDFSRATTFVEEQQAFGQFGDEFGLLAYISPEQTGRMNRPVDYRSDLYSLGATLYALATGNPPFQETDTLELIHAHLARTPPSPRAGAPWLPQRLAELILILLAKEPDQRYQSAGGLAHDLAALRTALVNRAPLEEVTLQAHDLPISPRPPRRLHGRERELTGLMSAFDAVRQSASRCLFLAGYSGVGKTTLVRELNRPVTLARGRFIGGKFDQFQHDRPFDAPLQGLRHLCQMLLAEAPAALELTRQRLSEALGPDAAALYELLPELERLLGPQVPPQQLGPRETTLRLRSLLVSLIRLTSAPEHPLVLFLDDLQWADQPSLELIAALLDDHTLTGFLLIGAYRDNEIDASHPLRHVLRLSRQDGRINAEDDPVMMLDSLSTMDTVGLIADMLHQSEEAATPLADCLYAKTSGNPFFTIELVHALYREGALRPDPERSCWQWDSASLLEHTASANVVDFLAADLANWQQAVPDALVAAAALGNKFTLGRLALATAMPLADLTDCLLPALDRGILVTRSAQAFRQAANDTPMRFCHDRMQQAVYKLRDEDWRARLHLEIARHFSASRIRPGLDSDPESSLGAAEHYARCLNLIEDSAERSMARQLLFKAAIHARHSGAFDSAERLVRDAIRLLAPDAWYREPGAAFDLHAELHLALYSQSRHDEADALYAELASEADSPLQLVDPTCVQIASLSSRTRYAEAVSLAGRILNLLDLPLPADTQLMLQLGDELELFYQYVESDALDTLLEQAASDDPKVLGAARLLNAVLATSFSSQPMQAFWIVLRATRLAIERGYFPDVPYIASCLILATVCLRGDYRTGYRGAAVALARGQVRGQARDHGIETARAQHQMGALNSHWFNPLADDIVHARAAFSGCVRGGDLELACLTFFTTQAALLDTCTHLDELKEETGAALSFARRTGNQHAAQIFRGFQQLVRALEGQTAPAGSFDDENFDEQAHVLAAASNPMALCYFHIYRALSACLFNDGAALIAHAEAGAANALHITGFYPSALANPLHSLALIERLRNASASEGKSERDALLERLSANQEWLAARAEDAPMNFGFLHTLIKAERLDVLEHPWRAQQAFEVAMRQAQAQQRAWPQALITERAGYFCMRRGLEHAGRALLIRACQIYQQWGATGKVQAMRNSLPFINACQNGKTASQEGAGLDYQALLRASQALTSETSMSRLLDLFVELLGQLTGASDVRLLMLDELDDKGEWLLEGGRHGAEKLARMSVREAEEKRILPASGTRLILNSLQLLISDDAVVDSRFQGDPYFATLSVCSVLALPVVMQGRVSAFLILENHLYRAAFAREQIEILSMLCQQLAISFENARVYQSLERKVAERTRELEIANEKLQELSELDGLTGIANRRKFDTVSASEWQRAIRQHLPLAILMIDVDHFKAYNDHYGHQAGDSCLRQIAQALASTAKRVNDLVARYGGEEFVVLLPGSSAPEARLMAERLREAVMACGIPHVGNSAAPIVTISIGVVSRTPEQGSRSGSLLEEADAMLYQSKKVGRNRVSLAA